MSNQSWVERPHYWGRYETWREDILLEMADELDEVLVGNWYTKSYGYMKLWSPGSASALDSWSNYAGDDMSDHYACLPRTRDSEDEAESNWRVAVKWFTEQLGEESEMTWMIGSWNHWACGWIERILIHKDCWRGIRLGNKIGEVISDGEPLDEDDLRELETEHYDEYVSEYFAKDGKLIDKFYEMVGDSNTDCGTVDTFDEELADYIKSHLFLRKLPVPDMNAIDDEGNVWLRTVTIHECIWCEEKKGVGYYQRGVNPEETYACDECISWGERLVDENQEKLAL
jgi:hypothetical protein